MRPGDHEEVRESVGHDAQIGARALTPVFLEADAVPAFEVKIKQWAGEGIEAGGVNQTVKRVCIAIFLLQSMFGDPPDRIGLDVHQDTLSRL